VCCVCVEETEDGAANIPDCGWYGLCGCVVGGRMTLEPVTRLSPIPDTLRLESSWVDGGLEIFRLFDLKLGGDCEVEVKAVAFGVSRFAVTALERSFLLTRGLKGRAVVSVMPVFESSPVRSI
jgi:hypothetical protein